jgi:putative zinc finger/helix-turn-helix YgiT family protein
MFVWSTRALRADRPAGTRSRPAKTYHHDKSWPTPSGRFTRPAIVSDTTAESVCPACKVGQLHTFTRTRDFKPRGRLVTVELLGSRCDACDVETTRAAQHDENLRRLAARKAQYGDTLLGEEIVGLRKRYGLTQVAAARLFGKGKIAFSRYENEATYPNASTTLLLTMSIEMPDSLKWLADKAGVEIPMWRERCEDALAEELKPVAAPVHRSRKSEVAT